MTLDLFLSRHGESEWHAENRYAGVSDIDLTPAGRQQAVRLATWAGQARLDAVRCSSLGRARETAEPAARAVGVPLVVDERLREVDFGIAEGLTKDELSERHPDALEAFRKDPVGSHFPDGEHPQEAAERFLEGVEALRARVPDGRALVVAHSTVVRLALCRWLGVPLEDYRRALPHLDNGALTRVALTGDSSGLLALNVPLSRPPTTGPTR